MDRCRRSFAPHCRATWEQRSEVLVFRLLADERRWAFPGSLQGKRLKGVQPRRSKQDPGKWFSSLRNLGILCVSAVKFPTKTTHRGDAEIAEDAQSSFSDRLPGGLSFVKLRHLTDYFCNHSPL